jgi:hypothetical protein
LDVGVGSRWRIAIINHSKLVIWLIDPDWTKVAANAALDAKRIAGAIIEQISCVIAEAEAADAQGHQLGIESSGQ